MNNDPEWTEGLPQNVRQDFSYLLRVWAEKPFQDASDITWRYSLRNLSTKAQRGFADLDSLVAYFKGIEGEVRRYSDD
jgi:hypothetical protein